MTDTIKISRELLERMRACTLAWAAEYEYRHKQKGFHPDHKAALAEADALLATPPADAADMGGQAVGGDTRKLSDIGNEIHNLSCHVVHVNEEWAQQLGTFASELWNWGGQAGEEVGLNGLIVERDIMGAMHIKLPAYDGGAPIDLVQIQYRYPYTDNASTKRLAEKIAGLISGKLEAVSSEELAQHRQQAGKLVEALRKISKASSGAVVKDIADEALADWEKTQ